jgi:hypothetical protein
VALNEDLDVLERSIRQLQIEWEKFFGGVEKKQPVDLKTKVEALIRRYAYAEIRNNAERFRYQTMTARYNTFNELWGKKLRALEEGRPLGFHGSHVPAMPARPAAPAPPPSRPAAGEGGEFRVKSPERDAEAVKALFQRFIEARRQAGESGAVKYESFQKLITQQTSRLLTEKGGQAVDFRLETKDGKVSLKAKLVM